MKSLLLEKHIQEYVVQYMELDGWRAFKMEANSDTGFVGRVMQKIRKHPLLTNWADHIYIVLRSCMRAAGVGEVGMADYLFIRYLAGDKKWQHREKWPDCNKVICEALFIEFKRPGQKPRPEQKAWKEAEERRGALVWVIDSQDAFLERYRGSGLQRKNIS